MTTDKKGLALILHSGSYDRLYHGLSLALAASALGREVRLFFTYWALGCMKKNEPSSLMWDVLNIPSLNTPQKYFSVSFTNSSHAFKISSLNPEKTNLYKLTGNC